MANAVQGDSTPSLAHAGGRKLSCSNLAVNLSPRVLKPWLLLQRVRLGLTKSSGLYSYAEVNCYVSHIHVYMCMCVYVHAYIVNIYIYYAAEAPCPISVILSTFLAGDRSYGNN